MDRRQRVLAIDDAPEIHALLRHWLRDQEIELAEATTWHEAIDLARRWRPDLILLDLNLGQASGLALCSALKSDPIIGDVPIVFLTGTGDTRTKVRGFDLGAVDYVVKPFEPAELQARVRAALRTKRYQDLLASAARIDALTGAFNRRHFDERLFAALAGAARQDSELSLLLIDLDHFKRINDRYGHPTGERVLVAVARLLRDTLRACDVVCRYGGEEFAAILPDTGTAGAREAAERLCGALRGLSLRSGAAELTVTASIGVATRPAHGTRSDALVAAADEATYRAKAAGRDRVCVAGEEAPAAVEVAALSAAGR